jgi:long-chain acyl-CoA synthetase
MLDRILHEAAEKYGDKTALISNGRALTYRELDDLSSAFARALNKQGTIEGDRVSIYSQNRWEWVIAYHGILKAGAVVNPINVMLTAEEVGFVLNNCGARAVVTSGDKADAILALAPGVPGLLSVVDFDGKADGAVSFAECLTDMESAIEISEPKPTALSTIGHTSGTTGHPKGAMQSHLAVYLNCALTATMHVRTSRDIVVTALPAPHVYGNVAINSTFMSGGTVVLMERFDASTALGLIAEHRATMFEGVPTMYAMMLADPGLDGFDLSSLTHCTVGGQTIATSVMNAWEDCSQAPLIELWGMTELAGLGTTHALYAPARGVHVSVESARQRRRGCRGSSRQVRRPGRNDAARRTRRVDGPRTDRHARLLRHRNRGGDRRRRLASHG